MADIDVRLPDGRLIRIVGAESDEAARSAVQSMLQQERRDGPRTGSSVARGIDQLQGSLYSAGEGIGRATGLNWLEQFGRAGRERNEREAEISQPSAQVQSFEDAETLGDYARAAGQAIGSNVPQMGLSLAGAAGGAALGSIVPGVGTAAGAIAGMLAPNFLQIAGANRARQMQANPDQPVDEAAAFGTAVPQAVLDTASDRILLGLGRVFGRSAQDVGRTLVPRIARGLGIGAATEVPTEVLQQALERAQAGLDVLSPEAMREYREAGIAAGVTGGTMGGTLSGALGARPAQQLPPAPAETQAQNLEQPDQTESLLPPPPVPIEDAAEARQFLTANREFTPRFEVSDDEALVLANRFQNLAHRQEVDILRNNEIARFLGMGTIRQVGETEDRGVQADQLLQRLTQVAADPEQNFDIGNFQPEDVANLAVARLGPEAEGPTRREIGVVRQQLVALQRAGFLTRGEERGTFAIAPRPIDQLRQRAAERAQAAGMPTRADRRPSEAEATERQLAFPGLTELATQAPPTQQQTLASEALSLVGNPEFLQQPVEARGPVLARLEQQDPQVGELARRYVDSLDRQNALNQALATNPALASVPEIQAAAQALASERAQVTDLLTGLQNVSAIAAPESQLTLTDAPTRGPGGFPGDLTPNNAVQVVRRARALQEAGQFDALLNDPAQAVPVLQAATQNLPPRYMMSWNRWVSALREAGIPFSESQGAAVYAAAKREGIVDGLGRLAWRPVDKGSPTPTRGRQERTAPPTRQRAPAAPTRPASDSGRTQSNEGPAFEETDAEPDARLDERTTDEPNFARGEPGAELPGLRIDEDGYFDYSVMIDLPSGSGNVSLTGDIQNGVMSVRTALATNHVRGKGYGLQAYQNLVNYAHANGLDFQSDSQVSDAAGRVYAALSRRGYKVETLPPEERYRSSGSWVADDYEQGIYRIPKPGTQFARQGPQTELDSEVAAEAGERAFRQVLGANGRLEIRDRVFLSELDEVVQEAAREAGITHGEVDGVALGDLAILGLRDTTTPIRDVAIHEGFHIAENLGLFTPQELSLLNANLDNIRKVIRQYNPNIAPEDLANPSEVRAYGLNARVAQRADFGPLINRIYDKFVNMLERIGNLVRGQGFQTWRDVYDAFEKGGMAGRAPTNPNYVAPPAGFVAQRLPTDTKAAHKIVKEQYNQIGGFWKWFGSPIMSLGKVRPALMPASDQMRQLHARGQEASVELNQLLAASGHLTAPQRVEVTRAWEQASRTKRAPNYAAMSPESAQALRDLIGAGQRALDYMIESYVHPYFQPGPDKTPQQRARLEAMWNRHPDKHLWEIPARELAAASPTGWAEMQSFEKLRNPYYMPMMTQGTHFVAVYERKGTSRKLTRLVAYTPLNRFQKLRGFPDPEKAAQEELRRQFPNERRYEVMGRGQQFTQNAEAAKKRDEGDFISQYLNELAQVTGKRGQQVIARMQKDLDKAQIARLFRSNQDILQAITPQNESSYILDSVPQYMLSAAKIQARRYTQPGWTKALERLTPDDQAFLNDLRDYESTPTEAFGASRALAFFMYLGFSPSTAIINATQMTQSWAFLTRDGGLAASRHLGSAMRDAGSQKFGELLEGRIAFTEESVAKILKNPDEAAAVVRAYKMGVFNPMFTHESRGQFTAEGLARAGVKNASQMAINMNKISHGAGMFLQYIEEFNRLSTFLGAYRLAKAQPGAVAYANRADNTELTTAYDYAASKVTDTQYLTTKADRAYIQRFTPAAEVATQFQSFVFKTTEQYVRATSQMLRGMADGDLFMAKAGAVLLLNMSLPVIAMAGIWGLPGGESLRRLLEMLTSKLWGSTQNFDTDVREMLGGGRMAEAIVRGVPQALNVASLRNRVGLDPIPVQELSTMSVVGLAGPVGGLAEAWFSRMPQYVANGDYWNAAAVVMPRAVGDIVRGAQLEIAGEQRTLRGNRVVTPQDVARHDSQHWVPASVRQMIGFPPPEFVNMREMVAMSEEVSRRTRDRSERLNKEMAGYLTDAMEARRAGNNEEAQDQMRRYAERLREVVLEQSTRPIDRQIRINPQAITQRAVNDFYGIASPEVLGRRAPTNVRPEIARQRQLLDWRNQPPAN